MSTLTDILNKNQRIIINEYNTLCKAIERHRRVTSSRYVSVPKFFEELGLFATYTQMLEMGKMATERAKIDDIVYDVTPIGVLYRFSEEVLDMCFEDMTVGGYNE